MWPALVAAIDEGRDPYYTKDRALRDLTTLLAIQRSAQEKAIVQI